MKMCGTLHKDVNGETFFRVYDKRDEEFTDYYIKNWDLSVTIDDKFAQIRTLDDGTKVIDHDDATLGYKKEN